MFLVVGNFSYILFISYADNYSVHPKIISEQTPSDTPNSVQVSSNEPDVKVIYF